MKKIFICTMLLVLCLGGIVSAAPMYYTFEGPASVVYDDTGMLEEQGIENGTWVTFTILIDFEVPGMVTYNSGVVEIQPSGYFYAKFISGTKIEILDGGYYNGENHIAEYNWGNSLAMNTSDEYDGQYRTNIYVQSSNDFIHFYRKYTPLPFWEWELGEFISAYGRLFGANGEVSAYGVHGSFVSITPVMEIEIDIKPGSCPNPLNIKSKGVLPIAILGTDELDITTIDPASIRLAGVAPIRSNVEDVGAPVIEPSDVCDCATGGVDGFLDLTLKFNTQEIVGMLGEVADGDQLVLTLTGETYDGTPIKGQDCVVILKKGKEKGKK